MTKLTTRLAAATAVLLTGLAGGTTARADNTSGVPMPPQPHWNKGNAAAYGAQIARYVRAVNRGWRDAYAKSTITIINARGDTSTSKTRQLTKEGSNGDKSVIRYISPANVRGVAALTHEHHDSTDDSWLYLPSSRRVRRISGANRTSSFQGTEFTYEDMTALVPSRYRWRFLATTTFNGQPVFQLRAIPTYRNSAYSKQLVYINRKLWRVEGIKYYDQSGRLLKVLTFSKWQLHHGRFWRARKLDMHNTQTQKRSVIDIGLQFVNLSLYTKRNGKQRKGLPDSLFTRRALEGR